MTSSTEIPQLASAQDYVSFITENLQSSQVDDFNSRFDGAAVDFNLRYDEASDDWVEVTDLMIHHVGAYFFSDSMTAEGAYSILLENTDYDNLTKERAIELLAGFLFDEFGAEEVASQLPENTFRVVLAAESHWVKTTTPENLEQARKELAKLGYKNWSEVYYNSGFEKCGESKMNARNTVTDTLQMKEASNPKTEK